MKHLEIPHFMIEWQKERKIQEELEAIEERQIILKEKKKESLLEKATGVLMAIVLVMAVYLITVSIITPKPEPFEVVSVIVRENETLWQIASRYTTNEIDIRKHIYDIRELNDIDGFIYPGQQIFVPSYISIEEAP